MDPVDSCGAGIEFCRELQELPPQIHRRDHGIRQAKDIAQRWHTSGPHPAQEVEAEMSSISALTTQPPFS